MSLEVIVYILTALAAVVVVLTRLRLRKEEGAGRHKVGTGLLNVHTFFGTLALLDVGHLPRDERGRVLGRPPRASSRSAAGG